MIDIFKLFYEAIEKQNASDEKRWQQDVEEQWDLHKKNHEESFADIYEETK